MSDTKEIHQLSLSEFKDLIGGLSLESKRAAIPDLNRYYSMRKLTWSLLRTNSGEFKAVLPLEAQFTYAMLLKEIQNYDNSKCVEILLDTFNRIKENEEICRYEANLNYD